MTSDPPTTAPAGSPDSRAGLVVLALSVFTAVTTEMVPVGVLPLISRAFAVSEATAGRLVSLFAVLVMLLAVPITLSVRRISGKRLLLLSMAGYAVSNVWSALAPTFVVLGGARALGGLTHALFFSVCIGYASRLVPPDKTGRALALVSAGVSTGLILGSPLATALGNAAGWRAAFWALAGLTVITFALTAWLLPGLPSSDDAAHPAPRGRRRDAAAAIVANGLTYVGQFTLYTYVTVLLLQSGAPAQAIAPLLFVFGLFGLVGIWRAAPQLDARPRRTGIIVLSVVTVGFLGVGAGFPVLVLVVIAGVVWNTAFGPMASLYQSATVRTNALSPELAGAWINATANFGIAGGALLGGFVLETFDVAALAWVGAVLIVASLVVVATGRRAFPSRPQAG